jgi:hypothetical protein
VDPEFVKKGGLDRLYKTPPKYSIVVCLDEMGPVPAKSYPEQEPVKVTPEPDDKDRM